MEDEERQKKLEAGKAKLAEYRQRKAHADSQRNQKRKKKKRTTEDSEGDSQGRVDPDQSTEVEDISVGGRDGAQEGTKDPPTTEFTFARTLRSGERVKHDQTYTIEPESEVSTTAEDYSSEVNGCHDEMMNLMMSAKDFIWEEVESLPQVTKGGTMQDALAAKTQAVEELSQEEIRAAFGTEGVQQLQDFEAALKQRDGIITQLTANLQQAREEKDEIMKEFLELTEQSQKLQIQFQQLQAGETLRNTSHSSTAADLLQTRQQLVQYQQQLEEMNVESKKHQERSIEQLEHISQLQHKLNEMEMSGRRSEESFTQRIIKKDLLIAEQEKVLAGQEQLVMDLRVAEESFAQTLEEKSLFISEQTAIITEHERSLTLLREELAHVARTSNENIIQQSDEKDLIIAEQERVISERDCSLTQLEDELETSEKRLSDIQQRMAAKESELEKCLDELESTKSDLESRMGEMESCKLELENERAELESCKGELSNSRQKERMSSNEIKQLMGTVEDLQKRCHQGSLSESDTIQKMQDETGKKLEVLRAELDEMYGQQIVQMKQELNLQHAAKVEQMTELHSSELELLKAQLSQSSTVSAAEVVSLNARIKELQETVEQTQSMHDKTIHELSQVTQEKLNLQVKVDYLLQDLCSANEKVEQVSRSLISQESQHGELQRLQETIDGLRSELAAAQEAAQDAETKHESEVTNYKIKLEMLEREKDAVLDRMAESQEAELDRLRTQLLFSHEEELTHLREELQRESFMNTENLLNEAAVKHERVLHELRVSYEEELHLSRREKTNFATERDELLDQIVGLKEDLKLALHSSKADELVQQLKELQVEIEELRKGGEERARMENEIQTLREKKEVLEKQTQDKEQSWENKWKEQELEKTTLIESNNTLKEELDSNFLEIETLTTENNQIQQLVDELREKIENQRTTFSFAEKNFEVNYQELKEEYMCLIEAKTQLEERTLKDTHESAAKIASLQSQILDLEESSRDIKLEDAKTESEASVKKVTAELMEKLNVTLGEKEILARRVSEVTEKLMFTESKVGQLEDELMNVRKENTKVMAQNESLEKELEKEQEIMREQARGQDAQSKAKLQTEEEAAEPVSSFEDHHSEIQSLREEIKGLQSLLRTAEAERDNIKQTLDLQKILQTNAAADQSLGEGPVEGRSSPQKSTASGSNRRKRRQRSKQERKLVTSPSGSRQETQREEEEEAAAEEERATSAAEQEKQPQMESQVISRSQERASKEDSTDGYQGDGGRGNINKQVSQHGMDGHHAEPVACQRAEGKETTEHGECQLQMEAQRISLSQIHAAQVELLQEETDAHTHSLELKLQNQKVHSDLDEPKFFKYQNMLQAVSEECIEIILSFRKLFGEEFLESVDLSWQPPSEERPETSESTSIIQEARELYRGLHQVRERIEQEHQRLSQLQALLRVDGNKMIELQMAFNELKSSSEKEICDLRVQVASYSSSSKEEQVGAPSTSIASELQKLKMEAQEKQLQLEESHRQELERLRAHYQHEAIEAEERFATELFLLQQQLQEATSTQTHYSLSTVPESSSERTDEHIEDLKDQLEQELSEGGVELSLPSRFAGLTAQLQALRKALYHKYVQEVATLKEQHNSELRRLREESEQGRQREECQEERGEREQDFSCAGSSSGTLEAARQVVLEEKQHWERVEEEVAKAIVQMSVEFAQQTELARIKRSCLTSTSMQTRSYEEEMKEREDKQPTPRASFSPGAWMEEVERERLEKELEERNAEIRKLKEELQRSETAPEQALKKRKDDQEEAEEEEDPGGTGIKESYALKLSSTNDGESSDMDNERNLLRKANEKLSQVLVDVLKTTAAAEETMGLHMQSLCDASSEEQQAATPHTTSQRATWQKVNTQPFRPYAAGHAADSCQGSEASTDDVISWSGETEADEGLEESQQMMDSLLLGARTQLENEEYLMGIGSRLQTALEKMLMAITDTTNQLEHARMTQTELMRESFRHNQEMSELLQKQEELQERVSEESRAREQLALELHRAEGLIDGYTGERAALEEQLRQKGELQMNLEQELQVTSSRLQELEQERLQMQEERELLSRQQDAMRENAGPRELYLLEETEKLMKEKVEVQRQAEKENADLLKQVKLLEAELEEQVNRVIELEQAQMTESGDLQQQIQALEKQLEKNKRFLDEQAVDREHERDFFQQEIQKLEKQLKNPQKLQAGSEQRNREVDQLTSQLKEKADWCSELLLSSEQLRRELGERDEEIDKLESRIRELEQALLASAESLEKVEQKKQHASITETRHSTLEAQLQTEREALERKEKEICHLEEQLEQFREELENKSEEVQQLQMQLEIQSKEISSQQQYLETRDSLIQVMEEKDRQIALLNEQITKLQHTETASDNKEIDVRDELITDLESQVECLRSEQQRQKRNNEEELDQLNAVIDKLQEELANIEQKQAAEEDEDLKGEAEHGAWGPATEDYDEMKQRMDLTTKELDTLKTEHSKLMETYLCLKESTDALYETKKLGSSEGEFEEALREKTAGLVVMQAQVQALEQSATSRVEELGLRIRELEDLVVERDAELSRCRLLVEQTQSDADGLQQRVSNLEGDLREKVALGLVSQAAPEAFQQQQKLQGSKENQDMQRRAETQVKPNDDPHVRDFGDFGIPQMDFSGLGQARQVSTGKVVHLTQKLWELEVGLSGMQKDQELQKQLLSSSEEEVLEYERRLAVLMDLLSQMKARTHQRSSPAVEASSPDSQPSVSELLQELQEVKDETSATKEQLDTYKESCSRLQEELQEKTVTLERLQEQLKKVSSSDSEQVKLQQELLEAQDEAAAAKEELNSCRESLEKLQELLQEREMTIAHLKGELFEVKSVDGADRTELLQELQEVRDDVASTKEELSSSRQQNERLQEEHQVRELSLSKLKEELQQLIKNVDSTKEELNSYRQQNEKLQEELQVRELSISKLKEELQQLIKDVDSTKEELNSSRQQNEKLQEEHQVRELSLSKLKEELQQNRQQNEKLQDELNVRELSISKLKEELQLLIKDVDTTKGELNSYRQQNEKLQEELQVREVSISKLKEELQQNRQQDEKLQEQLQVRELSISNLKEEHQQNRQQDEKLQEELQIRELSISKLKEELQENRQQNEKLQEELQFCELSISRLKDELKEAQTALKKTADSGPPSTSPSPSPSPSPQPQSSAPSSSTTQPKRKGAKQPAGKGSSAKDKPSLSKKNSTGSSQSSNRSHGSRLNSSFEQQHVAVTESFTQTEPLQMSDFSTESKSAAKEEMEEMISEFEEKIVQMQELHAAEILDMEARHITESENLRRDIQALEDECKALKSVIDKLRSAEAPTLRQERSMPQFKDGYTSDSSSDYSQRTGYDLPSLHQEFRTTPEGARREADDPMPDRIKMLLREVHQEGMQVLSLSEMPLPGGEPGNQFNVQGWMKERGDLLATVESLKGLITQMQTHRETQASGSVDWRAELLDAVRQVFLRERSVLKNILYSQLDLLDTSDAIIHLNQLERRLAEQDALHRDAMGSLHTAERTSLISEIHQLRGQLEQIHSGVRPAASLAAECSMKEQREGGAADGAAAVERMLGEELKVELSQTKLELETTLKTQHKHLKELDTLRVEVSKKAAELDALSDQLTDERKRSRDLQWAMEKEKCRTGRTEESKREEMEDLHLSLDEQKSRVAQLTLTLNQERQASSQLSQQGEQERLSLQRHLQELQVQLDTERAKVLEMSNVLGRERELRTTAASEYVSSNEERVEKDSSGVEEEGSLLERLQTELDNKHTQVVHLLGQVEAQKLEVVRKEEELNLASQRSRMDQETLLEARAQLENLEAQISETQEQLEREMERRKSLEDEKERLEERLTRVEEQRRQREGSGTQQADSHSQAAWHRDSPDRTTDWVFQQKSGNASPHLQLSPTGHTSGPHHGPWRTVDKIVGKLHLVSSKIRSMANKTTGRLTAEVDSEELSWVQSSVDEVITMLQQSPGLPSIPESVSLLAGGSSSSSNSLTERLLRQNAELTGFVSRLTEEKNDLRNHTLRLEEELRRYRQTGLGSGESSISRRGVSKMDSASALLSHEREAWTREKIRLEKALNLAQTQVARLRGEIRTDALREITGPEADNAALKRMYGKYLRSESFRKALIYQKKYLLLLLGGFQECEEATLSLLSRMGGRPSLSSLESFNQRRRGLMRFRSAVRVSIALSRMRFLVKRWHKATGMNSTTFCSVNKNGTGQTSGTEVRDSPYLLHPGSVEMYRDKSSAGGVSSSSRGRSGRESPRSAVCSTPHRFHLAGDHGALTCSHLQSYDPDRALTDYISRLEALQRRLGNVTSGASSYAQLHFGLRR
ncbi:A-kinase anchor protein 9 isoform X4 [Paralichthys olivaceus]|uniref:A-kinase anchor protein 9 isoform X4 n=1 Tax=Paralichthys olivaceus TaxID=8255 RepID=UPI00375253EF